MTFVCALKTVSLLSRNFISISMAHSTHPLLRHCITEHVVATDTAVRLFTGHKWSSCNTFYDDENQSQQLTSATVTGYRGGKLCRTAQTAKVTGYRGGKLCRTVQTAKVTGYRGGKLCSVGQCKLQKSLVTEAVNSVGQCKLQKSLVTEAVNSVGQCKLQKSLVTVQRR